MKERNVEPSGLRVNLLDGWPASLERWQKRFLEWLDHENWSGEQILDWMRGFDLPGEDVTVEPHLWVWRAIPLGRGRGSRLRRLAQRLGKVLDDRPETRRDELAEKAIDNLLYLCAALDRPDELGEPLDRLFRRVDLAGIGHGVALRAALIWNQKDARWLPLWKKMVEGEPDALLPGNMDEGLEGILNMRPPVGPREKAPVHEIGWAMGRIAERLEAHKNREHRFLTLLELAQRRRPGLEGEAFSYMKLAYDWPEWTGRWVREPDFTTGVRDFLLQYFEDVTPAEANQTIGHAGLLMCQAGSRDVETLKGMAEHLLRSNGKQRNSALATEKRAGTSKRPVSG